MEITPDAVLIWRWGPVTVNATILFTWVVMAILCLLSWIVCRGLTTDRHIGRWQNLLEILVAGIRDQIRAVGHQDPSPYQAFIGTLFLFIALCNLLTIVPGYLPPTGSLSTTAALAICVFVAVPVYGIASLGLPGYLRQYLRPTVLMLPFNVIGEVSRTLALAVRLFGNVMSGAMIAGILLSVTPLVFPIVMQAFGLLTGLIQAYIFSVLAMVYISSASRVQRERIDRIQSKGKEQHG